MQKYLIFILLFAAIGCVPIKKYRDLESNYNKCMEEQSLYKTKAIDFENQLKELNVQMESMRTSLETLIADTTTLGQEFRNLQVDYQKAVETNKALEEKYTQMVTTGTAENAKLINELEATRIELQKKEDRLNEVEKELNARS